MRRRIFISYRRSDSQKDAFLIAARLKDRYGASNVFIDENLNGGEIFQKELEKRLATCSIVLVVIGEDWLTALDDDGQLRLKDPNDWVRREVRHAIESDIFLIPVLVHGASVPRQHELPDDINSLVGHQAVPVRTDNQGFRGDMNFLFESIDKLRSGYRTVLTLGFASLVLIGILVAYQVSQRGQLQIFSLPNVSAPTRDTVETKSRQANKHRAEGAAANRKNTEDKRLAAKAEAKRLADEKRRLAVQAEAKRLADDKKRLAVQAEAKRLADEEKRLAEKITDKHLADKRKRLDQKTKAKRKSDKRKLRADQRRANRVRRKPVRPRQSGGPEKGFSHRMTFR